MLNEASIIVNQDGIKNLGSALMNAQTYEIFIDEQKVGELDGYHSQRIIPVASGTHSIYVRAYARDSVSVTRTYSCSQRYDIELVPGDNKTFSCGLMPGPPARGYLIFGGVLLALLLWLGPGPIAQLTQRMRSILVTLVAGLTLAGSWYGYSSKPGANIYLKEKVRAAAQSAG